MTTAEQPGTVYLVGAGPGDPELLTVKAQRLLSECDALVYDSLVPKEVLDLVPLSCERHFVGKRRGHHSVPQPSTNAVLVEMAQRHAVVAVKGGDPPVRSGVRRLPAGGRCILVPGARRDRRRAPVQAFPLPSPSWFLYHLRHRT